MTELVCETIFKLYLYADMTKMIHYTSDTMHQHELCDQVRDAINDYADGVAEQFFGYNGKPSFTDFSLKHEVNMTDDLGKLCGYVIILADMIRREADKEPKLSGIVSLTDDFKGELNKLVFLTKFDRISNYKTKNTL